MRNMKDSGIEWIGEIPEGWEVGKVKDYYKLQIGFTPDTKNELYYDDENGYDWVTISDLTNDKFVFETKNKISQVYINEQIPKIIPKNSLLYSFKLSVGKVSFTGKDMYSNEAIVSFLNSKNCNLKFLYYSSFMIRNNASENIYGAKILNQNLIKNANIIFPSLEEQELIADYLDNKVNEIDNIISKTKKTIEEYKKYKQSVITEVVTKGLNPNVEMKYSGIEWIEEIPKHWKVIALKHKVDLNLNCLDENTSDEYEFDYIEIGSVTFENGIENKERVKFENAPSRARRVVKKNDIIISTVRTYLKAIATIEDDRDTIVSTGFAVLTPRDINHCFLSYYVKSNCFAELVSAHSYGVSYPAINSSKIISFKVLVPPMEEQLVIGNYLDKKCTEIDKLISKKEQLIIQLEQYKKSLIYECVTGKKEVSPAYAD